MELDKTSNSMPIRFPSSDSGDAKKAFRRNGVLIIDELWPVERVRQIANAIAQAYPEVLDDRQTTLDQSHGVSENRYITPLVFGEELACLDLLLDPIVDDLLTEALGDDYVFETIGVIVAHPNAPTGHIHCDGSLYGNTKLDRILPSFAIAVGVPLAPMDEISGCTGFWPGSHLFTDLGNCDDEAMIAPDIPVGSAYFWDFRTAHRGLANRGDNVRPVLYVTACRRFWMDDANFEFNRNFKLGVTQAMLDRLDARQVRKFRRARLLAPG